MNNKEPKSSPREAHIIQQQQQQQQHPDFDDCRRLRQEYLEWALQTLPLASQPILPGNSLAVNSHWSLRGLFYTEIETLATRCQCHSREWALLRLVLPKEHIVFDHSQALHHLVSHTTFQGTVVLIVPGFSLRSITANTATDSQTSYSKWHRLEPGLHGNRMVRNAIISLDARVYDNTLIESTFVASQAVVVGCQSVSIVSFDDNCTNCSGSMQITVGAESGGGRELNLQAESTMIDVCEQLLKDHPSSTLATSHKPSKQQLQVPVPMMNIVCSQAIVCGTLIINNVFVYPHASIEAATSVEQTILFPYATIRTASVVKQTILQWSVSISGSSNVSNTMLMEHAHVGPSSILASSVLGPDVHVSAGEIHASIIGPNTNSHHQSLIIGILWPLGRGNVGYGANLGSNHTGRLPDQETVAGEGTFWGLSTVIKFPVDLSNAPYSIVAAGTQLSPQRVRMPFSLIVTNERNGGNSILPGWVLRSSPYTLARSEKKFATRRKAVHHDSYTGWRILRPDVIELCLWARQSLQTVVEHKPIYRNDKDIVGIGTAQLTEKGRIDGMQAYDDCIKRFALQGLVTWLEQHVNGNKIQPGSGCLDTSLDMELVSSPMTIPDLNAVEWSRFPWQSNKSELWNFQKALLLHEFPNSTSSWIAWLIPLLRLYIKLETNYAENIYNCKQRDDVRGAKVIPGYVAAHVVAEDDPVIQEARATADENGKTALLLLDRFTGNASIPLDSKL